MPLRYNGCRVLTRSFKLAKKKQGQRCAHIAKPSIPAGSDNHPTIRTGDTLPRRKSPQDELSLPRTTRWTRRLGFQPISLMHYQGFRHTPVVADKDLWCLITRPSGEKLQVPTSSRRQSGYSMKSVSNLTTSVFFGTLSGQSELVSKLLQGWRFRAPEEALCSCSKGTRTWPWQIDLPLRILDQAHTAGTSLCSVAI